MQEPICTWIRSSNEQDRMNIVCDLSRKPTLCGGCEDFCECPSLLAEDRAGFVEDQGAYQLNGF